ncbi:MAG: Gfo/Idh/MocA family oxidoreductase [Patescibacteria group bacterium]|nr:Gfo/Idh/MocA family oxidoreductase [Patescibacteria group bacterium]
MKNESNRRASRRAFLQDSGRVAAGGVLAGLVVPHVHAAENNTIQIALIGCGARGTGAAANALMLKQGPMKLVAAADLFPERVDNSLTYLSNRINASWDRTDSESLADRIDVPPERRFVGFDGYRKAMDCLRPGDIAIFASPPIFRWVHFGYAIEKGLNVFMEKPLTSDGPTSRRMLKQAGEADAKNLKVGVGLMSRHSRALEQLHQRIQDGEIGDLILMRAYRLIGPLVTAFSERWPGTPSELLWQIQRFHSFLWASGGAYNDFYIHVVDHCCWMKNALPVKARSVGGRHYRNSPEGKPYVDQNFDVYSTEYTFADGTKLTLDGRCMNGCQRDHSSCAHGTKGSAVVSRSGDCGPPSRTFKGHVMEPANMIWQSEVPKDQLNPYDNEWVDLVDAIRNDKPYNEVRTGVEASVVSNMGRVSAHIGREVTYDEILNGDKEYAPGADQFTMDSPAPVQADADGNYPIPQPGIKTQYEY